jgi:hypothetical protein
MNIVNFQNQIIPEIRSIISTWLDTKCLYSERIIMFENTQFILTNLVQKYKTRFETIDYVNGIFKTVFVKHESVEVILKTYLLLMLDYSKDDIKLSDLFVANIYRARLNRFLEQLYTSIKNAERLKGKTYEYEIVK